MMYRDLEILLATTIAYVTDCDTELINIVSGSAIPESTGQIAVMLKNHSVPLCTSPRIEYSDEEVVVGEGEEAETVTQTKASVIWHKESNFALVCIGPTAIGVCTSFIHRLHLPEYAEYVEELGVGIVLALDESAEHEKQIINNGVSDITTFNVRIRYDEVDNAINLTEFAREIVGAFNTVISEDSSIEGDIVVDELYYTDIEIEEEEEEDEEEP